MASGSLNSITKKRPSRKETIKAMAYVRDLDVRTMVIVVSALLEHGLERLIRSKMVRISSDAYDRLFFGTGPLSSFSEKIKIARAFGVVGPKVAHDFDIFNDVRNVFAHAAHPITFRNKKLYNRLDGIHIMPIVRMLAKVGARMDEATPEDKTLYPTVRGQFMLATGIYLVAFEDVRKRKRGPELERALKLLSD